MKLKMVHCNHKQFFKVSLNWVADWPISHVAHCVNSSTNQFSRKVSKGRIGSVYFILLIILLAFNTLNRINDYLFIVIVCWTLWVCEEDTRRVDDEKKTIFMYMFYKLIPNLHVIFVFARALLIRPFQQSSARMIYEF